MLKPESVKKKKCSFSEVQEGKVLQHVGAVFRFDDHSPVVLEKVRTNDKSSCDSTPHHHFQEVESF
jgi:hypothetical protein